ncbi:DUF58 domain-containing protein [Aureimonas jatrophae]|uniref:DUF58 domain-containing protein n=1 Tax=Aureimonas jatrophae TaxID=1166073 RepID=A0A1H0EMV0_9HYPH|nr:DUF58 domain-containing protein [Aureimonas jatrophae]MBB3950419.1 uncharacterized protein (DUF58 family) [Aureimonas jatrophae]SDN83671.1 Protein of unknown function DUF58 [Aureimonas jatrophae]
MPVGEIQTAEAGAGALLDARGQAALLPDLLVEARRVVATVTSGWHGRRRRGPGENFWQFRPFVDGEAVSRIDWRRSARDDSVYLRDREWEAAQTVWLWADPSPSMLYRSRQASASKEGRALVLVLALAELLARSGERIGYPGVMDPVSARNSAERVAANLASARPDGGFPPTGRMRRFSEAVLVGDFLDPMEALTERIDAMAGAGVRGHLVQVCDPAELAFPYHGRTEFRDPESGAKLTAGRAEALREEYQRLFDARRLFLADHCRRLGWSHVFHVTDRPASEPLIALHARLGGLPAQGGARA